MDDKDPVVSGRDHVVLNDKHQRDAHDADEGLQTLRVVEEEHLHLDVAKSMRLRRRADMVIMPVKTCIYHKSPASVA